MREFKEFCDILISCANSSFQSAKTFFRKFRDAILLIIAFTIFIIFLPLYAYIWNLNRTSILLLTPIGITFLIWWLNNVKNRGIIIATSSIVLAILFFLFQEAFNATNTINTIEAANAYNCSIARSIIKKFEEGKNLSNLDIRTKYKIEPYEDINNILRYYGLHAATNTLEKSGGMEVANDLIERVRNLVLVEQTSGPIASISANLAKSDYNATIRDISKDIERFICEEFRYEEPKLNTKYYAIKSWFSDRFDRLLQTMQLK